MILATAMINILQKVLIMIIQITWNLTIKNLKTIKYMKKIIHEYNNDKILN